MRVLAIILVTGCGNPAAPTAPVAETADATTIAAADTSALEVEWTLRDGCSPRSSPRPEGYPADGAPEVAAPPSIACVPRETGPCDDPVCEPPPSRCVDSAWLVYYANGDCVEGTCRFAQKLLFCSTGCSNGGCIYKGTTK